MKLVVAGSTGRMGRTLIEAIGRAKDAELAAALEVGGNAMLGKDAGELAGLRCGVAITADYAAAIPSGDCLIDFTQPGGTLAHLEVCAANGVRAVIGTTGFTADQRKLIEAAARRIPLEMWH